MKKQKITALIMAVVLASTSVVAAYAETYEVVETSETFFETEESVQPESVSETTEIEEMESQEIEETKQSQETTETVEQTENLEEDVTYEVKNAYVESAEIFSGDSQRIYIELNSTQKIINATLKGFAEDKGAEIQYKLSSVEEDKLIFEVAYTGDEADRYVFNSLEIETESGIQEFDLSAYTDTLTYSVFSVDKGSFVESGISFFSMNQFTGKYGNDEKFVVVLDPGHDPGCNTRGWVNGVWETDLNWRMALAMKDELEKYEGVEVYINREWDECPEETDGMDCLKARVTRAANLEADLLISLHNNALGSGNLQYAANGTEIYISKYSEYYAESKSLAEVVARNLSEMGLKNRGILVRDYGSDGGFYDDGNSWDYYAINRHSTMMGIPSLLIEHAYMDNPEDLAFLRDSEKVDEMGRRDAQAIVEYYGLSMEEEKAEITAVLREDVLLDIEAVNVSVPYSVEKAYIRVWSEKNGKDDIVWYEPEKRGNSWKVTVNMNNHNLESGDYNIELYYMDNQGEYHFIKSIVENIIFDDTLTVNTKIDAMYRVYNPNNGEHFYTRSAFEKNHLVSLGWHDEGIGWYAPTTGIPVYRLYNPNAGDHHYTLSVGERDYLVRVGWNDEGIGWYSDLNKTVPLYRLYNPNAVTGTHHYTKNYNEAEYLDEIGWNYEGISWYGVLPK